MSISVWSLPGDLVINDIDNLKQNVISDFLDVPELSIDCCELTRIDTIGVQFLIAFVQKRLQNNNKTQWQNVSEPLTQAIEQLGIDKSVLALN